MTAIFLAGPSSNPAAVNRLAALARDLHVPGSPVAFPTVGSTSAERIPAVTMADEIVLSHEWASDPQSRRDAQVAVWCGKVIKLHEPLRSTPAIKGGQTPALRVLTAEQVQDVIDRGLQLPAFPADGQAR